MKTSRRSMQFSTEEPLIFSAAGFPASPSVSQENERARTMTVTSGRRLSGLLQKSGPGGSFLKMLLDCSPFWSSRVYLKWRSRRLSFFVRTKHSRRIRLLSGSSAESLELSLKKSHQRDIYYRNYPMERQSCCVFQLAPLMRRTAGTGSGLLLTPVASDTRNKVGPRSESKSGKKHQEQLSHVLYKVTGLTGLFNPLFVAEMMGFPVNWTVSVFQNGEPKV